MQEFDKLFFRLSNLSGVRGSAPAARQTTAVFFMLLAGAPMTSPQRDKALKCECHLQSKDGTRNSAICRYSFVRYERYSLTATIRRSKIS